MLRLFDNTMDSPRGCPHPPGTMERPWNICQVIVKLFHQFAGYRAWTGGMDESQGLRYRRYRPALQGPWGPQGGTEGNN